MIFSCPSGHREYLGDSDPPSILPLLGVGAIAFCLQCKAKRRFEWKRDTNG